MNWSRGGLRWIIAGMVSLAFHVILVGSMLGFSFVSKPDAAAVEPAPEAKQSQPVAPAEVQEGKVVERKTQPEEVKPQQDIEKIVDSIREPERKERASTRPVKASDTSGTLDQLAGKFEESARQVAGTKTKSVEKKVAEKTAEGKSRPKFHVVKSGDTLTKIVREYGITAPELAKLNGVSVKTLAKIKIGQRIRLSR